MGFEPMTPGLLGRCFYHYTKDDYTYDKILNLQSSWSTNGLPVTLVIQYCACLDWILFWFRCGFPPVPVNWKSSLLHHILQYLRTLNIVWSLVRHRVTRRLIRLHSMYSVLKYRRILVWVRFGSGYFFNLLICSVLYTSGVHPP